MNLKGEELSERLSVEMPPEQRKEADWDCTLQKILPRPSMVNFRFSWTEIYLKSFWISRSMRDRRRREETAVSG